MRADYQCTGVGTVLDTDIMLFSVQLFATNRRLEHGLGHPPQRLLKSCGYMDETKRNRDRLKSHLSPLRA